MLEAIIHTEKEGPAYRYNVSNVDLNLETLGYKRDPYFAPHKIVFQLKRDEIAAYASDVGHGGHVAVAGKYGLPQNIDSPTMVGGASVYSVDDVLVLGSRSSTWDELPEEHLEVLAQLIAHKYGFKKYRIEPTGIRLNKHWVKEAA